jgi:hypothetical protein
MMGAMRLPLHSWLGLGVLLVSEAAMLAHVEPFWTWHTPFAWTGYVLLVDGIVYKVRGSSWLTDSRREFAFLCVVSIPLWVVFEGYNLLIRNWYYINLPQNLVIRCFGFAWAFATISPGIFQTAELVAALRGSRVAVIGSSRSTMDSRLSTIDYVSLAIGSAMLLLPIVRPSPYLAAPVFLGFIFLLDPINARAIRRCSAMHGKVTTAAASICSSAGSSAGGCGNSGISGRVRNGFTRCRFSATSRFSRCRCSGTSASRRSRSNVSRCISSPDGYSGAARIDDRQSCEPNTIGAAFQRRTPDASPEDQHLVRAA